MSVSSFFLKNYYYSFFFFFCRGWRGGIDLLRNKGISAYGGKEEHNYLILWTK